MVKRIKTLFLHKIYIFWKIQFNRFLAHEQQRNLISNPRFHSWMLQRFLYITISMIRYKNLYNFKQLHYRVILLTIYKLVIDIAKYIFSTWAYQLRLQGAGNSERRPKMCHCHHYHYFQKLLVQTRLQSSSIEQLSLGIITKMVRTEAQIDLNLDL